MRKILLSFVLVMALLCPLSAETISLEDAKKSALENNTDMEIARLTLEQSLRSYSDVSSYIPNLSLSGSASAVGSTLGNTTLSSMDGMLSASFDLGLSMSLGTSLIGTSALNSAQRTIANLTYATSVSSLEQSVTTSYWALVSSKKSMESARLNLTSAERTLESVKESYEAGLATSLDISNAELSALNYRYALKQLEDAYELSKETFRTLTGIEGDFDVEDFPETVYLNLPSAEELFDRYANNTNSVRMLNASVTASEAALKNTRVTTQYPSVSLSLNYNLGGNAYYNNPSALAKNKFNDTATATVSFSIPISSYIPGSSANNTVKNAESSVAIRKLELNQGKESMLSTLKSTLLSLEQNRANIEIAKERRDLASRSYALAEESYNAGLITLSSLQNQRDTLSSAELSLITAESNYIQTLYTLAFTLNIEYESLIELYGEN